MIIHKKSKFALNILDDRDFSNFMRELDKWFYGNFLRMYYAILFLLLRGYYLKIIEILFNLLYKFGMCSLIILLEPHLSNLLRFLVRVILYTNINEIKVHIVRLFRSIIMMRYYSITACDGNKVSFMCALLQIIRNIDLVTYRRVSTEFHRTSKVWEKWRKG